MMVGGVFRLPGIGAAYNSRKPCSFEHEGLVRLLPCQTSSGRWDGVVGQNKGHWVNVRNVRGVGIVFCRHTLNIVPLIV